MPEQERTLSTTEISRLCKVAPKTVLKWLDSGRLKGFRTQDGNGRTVRRVPQNILLAFLRSHGMAIPEELRY